MGRVDDQRWRAEATEVLKWWDTCFDALPEPVRDGALGRLKSEVVREWIEARKATTEVTPRLP